MSRSRVPRRLSRREMLALARDPAPPRDDSGHWIRVSRTAMACRFEVTLSGEDARHVPAAPNFADAQICHPSTFERVQAARLAVITPEDRYGLDAVAYDLLKLVNGLGWQGLG